MALKPAPFRWTKWENPYKKIVRKMNEVRDAEQEDIPEPIILNIGEYFKLWVLHTSAPITDELKENLKKTNGVETFNLKTKYRAIIGIGECFDQDLVRGNVQEKVKKYVRDYNMEAGLQGEPG